MDHHQRIDDALEARSVNDNKKWPRAPTLRRRNLVRLKRHQRRLVPRGEDDSDAASGLDSGPDSGPDSDDEDITIPQSRPISLPRPSATLRVGSGLAISSGATIGVPQHTTSRFGDISRSTISAAQPTPFRFGVSSRTTIGAAQSTPVRLAPAIITSLARPTGLGSTLLAAEGDDLDSGVESLSDDDDSDDETTSSATSATTAPNPGDITTSNSLTSTTAATLSSSILGAAPSLNVIETSLPVTSASSSLAQSTTLSTAVVATPASTSGISSSLSSSVAEQTTPPTQSGILAPGVTPAPLSTLSLPSPQKASTQTTTASGSVGAAIPDQVLGSVTSTEHKDMSQGAVAGTVIGVLGMLLPPPILTCGL
ncbi:hypothetical protein BR93DRAFT_780468 [Coniochaeta sp. PMI_546]|nr:hypothetical protein BR93DRAFT_780468 [Coniochaeta sp. PMI_546]